MKPIKVGSVNVYIRPYYYTTYNTIYGIGKVKARCLNAFHLNHPLTKIAAEHKQDFRSYIHHGIGRNIFSALFLDKKIRLYVSHNLRDKILIFCHKAFRLFQNLPMSGGRTKANAGTPRHLNPYLSLKINLNFYPALAVAYKRRELYYNERFDELKAYNKDLLQKEKTRKADRKIKDKVARQNFIKNEKLNIK